MDMDPALADLLGTAVERGIISPAQRETLLELARESPSVAGAAGARPTPGEPPAPPTDSR